MWEQGYDDEEGQSSDDDDEEEEEDEDVEDDAQQPVLHPLSDDEDEDDEVHEGGTGAHPLATMLDLLQTIPEQDEERQKTTALQIMIIIGENQQLISGNIP